MAVIFSKDGTKIAFDKVGSGQAVILVNGAMSYRRAFDTTLEDLAELLSKDFTVYDYDRRGRGESGNTEPFTKVREIEDIQTLLEDAGGEAMLVGFSSGGAVALETAAVTPGVTKAFVYEVPFIVDDSRQPLDDYEEHTTKLVAEGKLDELIEYFITVVAGIPAEFVGGIKQDQAMWERMRRIAPTIPHDAAFMSEFMKGKPLPVGYWSKVRCRCWLAMVALARLGYTMQPRRLPRRCQMPDAKPSKAKLTRSTPRCSLRSLSNFSRNNAEIN
jgi:pimeloyl-ACP methyl ester carboxylesterase